MSSTAGILTPVKLAAVASASAAKNFCKLLAVCPSSEDLCKNAESPAAENCPTSCSLQRLELKAVDQTEALCAKANFGQTDRFPPGCCPQPVRRRELPVGDGARFLALAFHFKREKAQEPWFLFLFCQQADANKIANELANIRQQLATPIGVTG